MNIFNTSYLCFFPNLRLPLQQDSNFSVHFLNLKDVCFFLTVPLHLAQIQVQHQFSSLCPVIPRSATCSEPCICIYFEHGSQDPCLSASSCGGRDQEHLALIHLLHITPGLCIISFPGHLFFQTESGQREVLMALSRFQIMFDFSVSCSFSFCAASCLCSSTSLQLQSVRLDEMI